MDITTLALAKKFAKEYTDTHSSKLTEEDAIRAVANYFDENPNAIVTNDELETVLNEYFKKDDLSDLENIRAGAELGKTSLQNLPEGTVIDTQYIHTDNNYDDAAKAKVDAIPVNPKYTDTIYDDTALRASVAATGHTLDIAIDPATYIMTIDLVDGNSNKISTETVDLPLETMVVSAAYDSDKKEIILTLQNGSTTSFSVADLVSGLVSTATMNTELEKKLTIPVDGLEVGKHFRIAAINENGHPVLECVDAPQEIDIQINNASIITNDVANIPYASDTAAGVILVKGRSGSGMEIGTDGVLKAYSADNATISSRNSSRMQLSPSNMDFAVKAAMCDGVGAAWTEEEQSAARERMGAVSSSDVSTAITEALNAIGVAEEGSY